MLRLPIQNHFVDPVYQPLSAQGTQNFVPNGKADIEAHTVVLMPRNEQTPLRTSDGTPPLLCLGVLHINSDADTLASLVADGKTSDKDSLW